MEPAVIPLLLDQLQGDDAAEIRSACAVIGRMGPKGKQAVPALLALTRRADEEVRYAVFLAFTGIGTAALNDLTCMLRNDDASVRRLAAMVISELGGDAAPALSAICDASCDKDAGVRFWAVRALGRIGKTDARVANCLVRTAKDKDADVRWQTAVALHEIGVTASTREALASLQNDAHPAVRAQARRAN
jgi:HEAT repeat protein